MIAIVTNYVVFKYFFTLVVFYIQQFIRLQLYIDIYKPIIGQG